MRVVLLAAAVFGFVPQQTASPAQRAPVRIGEGATAPTLVRAVEPRYTPEALQAGVQGRVDLEVVVLSDGSVGDVRVKKSLNQALDAEAVAAAKLWKFRPGRDRDGNAVPVLIDLNLDFHARPQGTPPTTLIAPDIKTLPADFVQGVRELTAAGLTRPTVTAAPEPKYTSQAMLEKIQGSVDVDVVIGLDGRVVRARVARSLDAKFGLDDEALKAAQKWVFTPAMLGGQPVPVLARITLQFRLH